MYDNVWEKAKVPYKLIVILSDSFPLFGGPFRDSKNCHIKRLSYLPYLHISTWIHSSTLYFQHKDLLSVFAVPCTCLYAECVCVQMADAAKLESLARMLLSSDGGESGAVPRAGKWHTIYSVGQISVTLVTLREKHGCIQKQTIYAVNYHVGYLPYLPLLSQARNRQNLAGQNLTGS